MVGNQSGSSSRHHSHGSGSSFWGGLTDILSHIHTYRPHTQLPNVKLTLFLWHASSGCMFQKHVNLCQSVIKYIHKRWIQLDFTCRYKKQVPLTPRCTSCPTHVAGPNKSKSLFPLFHLETQPELRGATSNPGRTSPCFFDGARNLLYQLLVLCHESGNLLSLELEVVGS